MAKTAPILSWKAWIVIHVSRLFVCVVTLEDKSIELLDVDPQETEEYEAAVVVLDSQRKGKRAVIKTSTRQTHFLPVIGLVDLEKLKTGDLVGGVNKDSYLILETLPDEYNARVKAMEVDERTTEQYKDIGNTQTKSTFLKLAGPQLVQMFIGDSAKLVRDAFALAKEKSPPITSCTRLRCRRI
ncbi:26S proteasome regulatory subunit 6A-A-like [Culex pipiens pallens]|uniref:26S proteasome regulatory subunit 6A-A-like n=1 Tax=Culex pipiens pallens TaxID=42434 RepID=UPI0022AB2ED1|nr:26S proteasome regulatory subunit 6A-A-like [Culex pipiens pallens]